MSDDMLLTVESKPFQQCGGIIAFTPQLVALFKKVLRKADPSDPYVTMRKSYLMKAFLTWSKCAPLIQLCGELKKQLQERCSIVESLRESYYKDVISVKYHLERIGTLSKFSLSLSILPLMLYFWNPPCCKLLSTDMLRFLITNWILWSVFRILISEVILVNSVNQNRIE